MMPFGLRFDLRNPEFAHTSMADRYQAAVEMAEWADQQELAAIAVSEHHGSPDGYLPSPIPILAAMAARTKSIHFMIAAIIAPFNDPLRLAEDLIVLDNLSRGRVDLVIGAGYVHEEFEMFGVPMGDRARLVTEMVLTLKMAFAGEPFEYRGRTVHLTPAPFREGGPSISLGGSSDAAARRAARIADAFVPTTADVWDAYRDEVQKLGRSDPGPCPIGPTTVVALAHDTEVGWEQMAPYFLHEMNAYGTWQAQDGLTNPYHSVADVDELRETGQYRVLTPEEFVAEFKLTPGFFMLHPLCGGMPIDLAWDSLRLFEHDVFPKIL
jgi:alkanesulfonate monooxygenase SsuD/methylene tetrahydromethanopterin reductase-like flavin-dependent oxidoreductase (luciferase family)